MPHEMLVILNKNEDLLVKITSTIEGGAFLVKHVGLVIRLAGQITSRVAPSVAPSTGCNILILILFFRMNIVH